MVVGPPSRKKILGCRKGRQNAQLRPVIRKGPVGCWALRVGPPAVVKERLVLFCNGKNGRCFVDEPVLDDHPRFVSGLPRLVYVGYLFLFKCFCSRV